MALTEQFQRVAETVTKRLHHLLCAQVIVLDDRQMTIASSEPEYVGLPLSYIQPLTIEALHLPLHLDGQIGEVIIIPSDHSETISPRLTQVLVELVVSQAAVVAKLPNQHELKNQFIHNLLRGGVSDETELLREAQILGMDFTRPRAVILIDAADYILAAASMQRHDAIDAQTWRRIQFIIGSIVSFFHLPDDTICAYIGGSEIVVLKASSTQDLAAWTTGRDMPGQSNLAWANLAALKRASAALLTRLRCDTNTTVNIGIGRYHPGLQGLARSYQDAKAALSLGRQFRGQNQVHCLDDLGIAAFIGISDETTKIDLAKHLLTPLDQDADLIKTLDIFFQENCCPSTTAQQLSIHRNTLSYRLDKITSLTGLDPRRFDEAMQIRLALMLRSLHNEPIPLGKRPTIESREQMYLMQMPNAYSA
jgi:carbohydrate diacid regulator